MPSEPNTQYIQGLNYDLTNLLSIRLEPSSQPAYKDRERSSGKVIVCTKKPHDVSANLSTQALLDATGGVIFPGAIVKQDRTLAEGVPAPYTFSRSPIRIRIDLPGLSDPITVQSPSNISVSSAIDKAIVSWLDNAQKQGYKPPVRAFSTSRKSYTKEQIGIELGFGAQWGKNSATANLKVNSDKETSYVYRAFRQIYYSCYAEEPEQAGDLFAESVQLNSANMPATQPPGFVRSVHYGRIIVVQMITSSRVTEQEAVGALDFVTKQGVEINSNLHQRYESIAKESSFQVLVLGGGSDSAKPLTGDFKAIPEAIINGIEFSKNNPAYPISYTVADLKSRQTSIIKATTSYIETTCIERSDRSIKLVHRGGYVAKFVVTWDEKNEAGSFVRKSYDSGKKTNPWDHTLYFPGDAENFVVTGINDTGLVWDKHRQQSVRYPILDGDKTVTIRGTTLNMTISG